MNVTRRFIDTLEHLIHDVDSTKGMDHGHLSHLAVELVKAEATIEAAEIQAEAHNHVVTKLAHGMTMIHFEMKNHRPPHRSKRPWPWSRKR